MIRKKKIIRKLHGKRRVQSAIHVQDCSVVLDWSSTTLYVVHSTTYQSCVVQSEQRRVQRCRLQIVLQFYNIVALQLKYKLYLSPSGHDDVKNITIFFNISRFFFNISRFFFTYIDITKLDYITIIESLDIDMTLQCSHDISIWFLKYLDTSKMLHYELMYNK